VPGKHGQDATLIYQENKKRQDDQVDDELDGTLNSFRKLGKDEIYVEKLVFPIGKIRG